MNGMEKVGPLLAMSQPELTRLAGLQTSSCRKVKLLGNARGAAVTIGVTDKAFVASLRGLGVYMTEIAIDLLSGLAYCAPA